MMYGKDSLSQDDLKSLQRIAEDIPSGVSADVLKSILRVKQSEELLGSISSLITTSVNRALERVWTEFKVSEKQSHLKKLEKAYPERDVWRPITGEADVRHILADCLLKEKQELIRQIESVKEESEMLRPCLNKFREEISIQLKEISREIDAYEDDV